MWAEARGSLWAGEVMWQLLEPGREAESTVPPKEATWGSEALDSLGKDSKRSGQEGWCLPEGPSPVASCVWQEKALWLDSGRAGCSAGTSDWSRRTAETRPAGIVQT